MWVHTWVWCTVQGLTDSHPPNVIRNRIWCTTNKAETDTVTNFKLWMFIFQFPHFSMNDTFGVLGLWSRWTCHFKLWMLSGDVNLQHYVFSHWAMIFSLWVSQYKVALIYICKAPAPTLPTQKKASLLSNVAVNQFTLGHGHFLEIQGSHTTAGAPFLDGSKKKKKEF